MAGRTMHRMAQPPIHPASQYDSSSLLDTATPSQTNYSRPLITNRSRPYTTGLPFSVAQPPSEPQDALPQSSPRSRSVELKHVTSLGRPWSAIPEQEKSRIRVGSQERGRRPPPVLKTESSTSSEESHSGSSGSGTSSSNVRNSESSDSATTPSSTDIGTPLSDNNSSNRRTSHKDSSDLSYITLAPGRGYVLRTPPGSDPSTPREDESSRRELRTKSQSPQNTPPKRHSPPFNAVKLAKPDQYKKVNGPTPPDRSSSLDSSSIIPGRSYWSKPKFRARSLERRQDRSTDQGIHNVKRDGVLHKMAVHDDVLIEAVDGVKLTTTVASHENAQNERTIPEIEARDINQIVAPGAGQIGTSEDLTPVSSRRHQASSPPPVAQNNDSLQRIRSISPRPAHAPEDLVFEDHYSMASSKEDDPPRTEPAVGQDGHMTTIREVEEEHASDPAPPPVVGNGSMGAGPEKSSSLAKSMLNKIVNHDQNESSAKQDQDVPREIATNGIGSGDEFTEEEASSTPGTSGGDTNSSSGSDSGVGMFSGLQHGIEKAAHAVQDKVAEHSLPFSKKKKKQVTFSPTDDVRMYTPPLKRRSIEHAAE